MLSAVALLPMIPIFLMIGSYLGRPTNPYDMLTFLQGVLTACWVYILMEMVEGSGDDSSRMARRLALIVGFVFLHVTLVGLLAQTAFHFIQTHNPLKLLIDINPFSQLFILMEGVNESRLIANSDFQRHLDFRLYLLVINVLVVAAIWVIHRATLRGRPFAG
jgi:predicted membrane channel-forming protein YqfA (hemolysin III family)